MRAALKGVPIPVAVRPHEPGLAELCARLNVTSEEFTRYWIEVGIQNCDNDQDNRRATMEAALDYRAEQITALWNVCQEAATEIERGNKHIAHVLLVHALSQNAGRSLEKHLMADKHLMKGIATRRDSEEEGE